MLQLNYTYVISAVFFSFMLFYIYAPEPFIMIKSDKENYMASNDDSDVCYRYRRHPVDCTPL